MKRFLLVFNLGLLLALALATPSVWRYLKSPIKRSQSEAARLPLPAEPSRPDFDPEDRLVDGSEETVEFVEQYHLFHPSRKAVAATTDGSPDGTETTPTPTAESDNDPESYELIAILKLGSKACASILVTPNAAAKTSGTGRPPGSPGAIASTPPALRPPTPPGFRPPSAPSATTNTKPDGPVEKVYMVGEKVGTMGFELIEITGSSAMLKKDARLIELKLDLDDEASKKRWGDAQKVATAAAAAAAKKVPPPPTAVAAKAPIPPTTPGTAQTAAERAAELQRLREARAAQPNSGGQPIPPPPPPMPGGLAPPR